MSLEEWAGGTAMVYRDWHGRFAKGHRIFSPELHEKISRAHRGKGIRKLSEEARRNIAKGKMGNKYCLGHRHSEETKEKLRKARMERKKRLGYINSPEARRKQAQKLLGRKHSEAHKLKISLALRGKTFREYSPLTEEQKSKISEGVKKHLRLHPESYRTPNVTKPQKELYKIVKILYADAELQYPVRTKKTMRFADVAIPSLKLDIEFDCDYWHDPQKDSERDLELLEVGWKTIRVDYDLLGRIKEVGFVEAVKGSKLVVTSVW